MVLLIRTNCRGHTLRVLSTLVGVRSAATLNYRRGPQHRSRSLPKTTSFEQPSSRSFDDLGRFSPIHTHESQSFTLQDGRNLCFATYGKPSGYPVFLFHGTPGCRLAGRDWHNAAKKNNVLLIAPDRPGFGESSLKHGRTLAEWPDDVLELANHLRCLETDKGFKILGVSGGGSHAMACANYLSKGLLMGTAIYQGKAPLSAGSHGLSKNQAEAQNNWNNWPRLMGLYYSMQMRLQPRIDYSAATKILSKMDLKARSKIIDKMTHPADDVYNTMPYGTKGYERDIIVNSSPWGFDLEEIDANLIWFWCGEKDENVPMHTGQHMFYRLRDVNKTPTTITIHSLAHVIFPALADEVMYTLVHGRRQS